MAKTLAVRFPAKTIVDNTYIAVSAKTHKGLCLECAFWSTHKDFDYQTAHKNCGKSMCCGELYVVWKKL